MGLFTKAIVILLFAVSTPLVYRQFANDGTVKFMNSYYSNYKVIDQFLRQSAGHLDQAKDYINTEQLREAAVKINEHLSNFVETTKSKLQEAAKSFDKKDDQKSEKSEKQTVKPTTTTTTTRKPESKKTEKQESIKYAQCPGEDLRGQRVRLWSKQDLAKFDGLSGNGDKIYLGFLGLVYDVTTNKQHYQPGAEYSAFAGKDATLAFVTGNFTHDLHDNIEHLEEHLFSHIESWASFYNQNYPIMGRIEGKFFDSLGCATKELARVYEVFNRLAQEKSNQQQVDKELPECNSEYNGDIKKGKVWCTKQSGGVERDWIGVPRIYQNGESQRCACFNLDDPKAKDLEKNMSVYPGCDPKATECSIQQ